MFSIFLRQFSWFTARSGLRAVTAQANTGKADTPNENITTTQTTEAKPSRVTTASYSAVSNHSIVRVQS